MLLSTLALAAPVPSVQEASQQFKQGQYPAALEKVNAFLAANPKDAQGRFLKGLILTELNRQQEAIRVFRELTEDYPELPEPYNNLAVLYAAQGQYDRAKNSLESAIRTHPSYATAHENLGDIYAKMASQAYDKALQLDRGNASAQTKLSMIKDLLGPTRGADTGKARPPGGKAPARPRPGPAPEAAAQAPQSEASAANPAPAADPALAGEVEKAVQAWAAAWSRQDAEAYLGFYADAFKPAGGKDRAAWAEERRNRITRPSRIQVDIGELEVSLREPRAEARFRQRYESDRYRDATQKTLVLERQGGVWKIVEER